MSEEKEARKGFRVVDRRVSALEQAGEAIEEHDTTPDRPLYVQQLERRIETLEGRLRETGESAQGSRDDVEQAKTRIRREVSRQFETRRREMLLEFLDVADNLDRALDAVNQARDSAPLTLGVSMVRDLLRDKLRGFGIERIEALGARFDPSLHEAFSLVPVDTRDRDGTIIEIIKDGYKLNEELLRPASVAVARFGLTI
jgi:molecular chaperone GrpE